MYCGRSVQHKNHLRYDDYLLAHINIYIKQHVCQVTGQGNEWNRYSGTIEHSIHTKLNLREKVVFRGTAQKNLDS